MDITLEENQNKVKAGRASFRNMTPFFFQHQSLIANKHALFYRFDNREKRERIVGEFPIFMGWADGTYYAYHRELKAKEIELRSLQNELVEITKKREKFKGKIEQYIKDYYQVIGQELPPIKDLSHLLKITKNLPQFDDKSYVLGNYEGKILELDHERDALSYRKQALVKNIQLLDIASSNATSYNSDLLRIQSRSVENPKHGEYICPLCDTHLPELNKKLKDVQKSRQSLFEDLNKLKNYSKDSSIALESLRKERDEISQKILNLTGEINVLKKMSEENKSDYNLKEKAREIKHLIEMSLEITFGDSNILTSDQRITQLKEDINKIKSILEKYDFKTARRIFEQKLSEDMNNICAKLDFENELKPPNFKFYSETFDFSHELKGQPPISISEMGSGANWLACHISLFLGLHKQFAATPKCSIPSFIFLDQPSQVYFPKEFNIEDDDVQKVVDIYDAVIGTINDIKKESGFLPQVIITDHADHLMLKNGDFNSFVGDNRWTKDKKLI